MDAVDVAKLSNYYFDFELIDGSFERARQIYVAMIAKISATIMELFSERSGVLSGKKFDIKIVIDHQKLARCNRFLPGFSRFHHHLSISIFVTM